MQIKTLLKRVEEYVTYEGRIEVDHPQRVAERDRLLKSIKEFKPKVKITVQGGCAEVVSNTSGVEVVIKDLDGSDH